jgi:dihydropyrimidinase
VLDLAITGGTLFVPGSGLVEGDLGIRGDHIAAVASSGELPRAAETINASGLLVAPGIIDPHAHFGAYVSREVDVQHETRAALAGGVTSIGWFFHEAGSYRDAIPNIQRIISTHSAVDVFCHPILTTEAHLEELEACVLEYGTTSFKVYMSSQYFATADDDFLLRVFERAAATNGNVVVCIHAENDVLVKAQTERVVASRPNGTLRDWSDARPSFAEAEAIRRAAFLADLAGACIYIVHMNSEREVECIRQLKHPSRQLYAETVTHYLGLTVDHELGVLVKRDPPLRETDDVAALWTGVADGTVDTLGTDNVVGSTETNRPGDGIFGSRLGFTTLGTHLSVCLDEGFHKRGVDLRRLLEAMTSRPAQIFGLYPKKGTLMVGADADITLIDLYHEREVDISDSHSWSDFSPWHGKTLRGWPVYTIVRGQLAMAEGEIRIEPGFGRYLFRTTTGPPATTDADQAEALV